MPHGSVSGAVLDRVVPAQLDDAVGEFELDVQVTAEADAGSTMRRCDTSDTCGSTCASACVSN
jgi:FxLD family lantipeptide